MHLWLSLSVSFLFNHLRTANACLKWVFLASLSRYGKEHFLILSGLPKTPKGTSRSDWILPFQSLCLELEYYTGQWLKQLCEEITGLWYDVCFSRGVQGALGTQMREAYLWLGCWPGLTREAPLEVGLGVSEQEFPLVRKGSEASPVEGTADGKSCALGGTGKWAGGL